MREKRFPLLMVLAVIVIVSLACGFSVSTASIADAFMAKDPDGNVRTVIYQQDEVFYAIVDLANAPEDTTVKVAWIMVNGEGQQPNTTLDEVSFTSSDGRLTFDLANPGYLWPTGQYRVDISLNDELETSLDFQVQ